MRIFGRIVAALLALALLVGALLVAIEILVAGLGRPPLVIPYDTWYRGATTNPWSSPVIRLVLVGLVIAGLVLLFLALAGRKPLALPLQRTGDRVDADVTRKSLEQSLTRAAQDVDGVSGARVAVAKRRALVRATTNRRVEGDLRTEVAEAVERRLASVPLRDPLDVSVNLRTRAQ